MIIKLKIRGQGPRGAVEPVEKKRKYNSVFQLSAESPVKS
jgi:hypothetical protein